MILKPSKITVSMFVGTQSNVSFQVSKLTSDFVFDSNWGVFTIRGK